MTLLHKFGIFFLRLVLQEVFFTLWTMPFAFYHYLVWFFGKLYFDERDVQKSSTSKDNFDISTSSQSVLPDDWAIHTPNFASLDKYRKIWPCYTHCSNYYTHMVSYFLIHSNESTFSHITPPIRWTPCHIIVLIISCKHNITLIRSPLRRAPKV